MIKTGGVGWLAHRTDEAGFSRFIYSLIDFFLFYLVYLSFCFIQHPYLQHSLIL